MTQRLFVYGTLQPGRRNAHLLEEIGGSWQKASVRGRLYSEGWGAVQGYPALVLAEGGKEVPGFVFTSDRLSRHWERLDRFEGAGYQRVLTDVKLEDGRSVEAYVYVLNRGKT